MRKDAVLPHHRDQIRGNADNQKIQKRHQCLKRHPVPRGISLYQLESYAAPRKIIKRIMAIFPFGIKHSHSGGQRILRKVMIANNHVYPLGCRIFHLVNGLDTAVKRDYKSGT